MLFKLLPDCIKAALMTCKPNMEKVIDRCNGDYKGKFNKSCEYDPSSKEPTKVRLKCNKDEEFFNDACYKKCLPGFAEGKLFCKKGGYIERYNNVYNGEDLA